MHWPAEEDFSWEEIPGRDIKQHICVTIRSFDGLHYCSPTCMSHLVFKYSMKIVITRSCAAVSGGKLLALIYFLQIVLLIFKIFNFLVALEDN